MRDRRMITLIQLNQWDFLQPAVGCRCVTPLPNGTEQKQSPSMVPK